MFSPLNQIHSLFTKCSHRVTKCLFFNGHGFLPVFTRSSHRSTNFAHFCVPDRLTFGRMLDQTRSLFTKLAHLIFRKLLALLGFLRSVNVVNFVYGLLASLFF